MRVKLRRTIAGLLSVLVAFTMLLSGQAQMQVKAETSNPDEAGAAGKIMVSFSNVSSVKENVVTYTVGDKSVTLTVSGNNISDNSVVVPTNAMGSVEFILDDSYDSDTMQVKVSASDGFNTLLTVNEKVTSLAKHNANGGLPDSLELVVEAKSSSDGGGGNPGDESTPVSISLGETELLHEGKLTEAYDSFSGVSEGKVVVEDQNERGVPQITFDGYNGGGQILKIEGNSNVSVVFKKGTTKLKGIALGEDARVDVDAMDVEILEPARLELAGGICASDTSKPANSIRFTNNIILGIGTEANPVDNAFSGIRNVNLDNYEFHSRETINTIIYATTAFREVESIDIYCSKVQANATKLFERSGEGSTTDCIVHTEGQIRLKGTIGSGKLKSNYYFQYPTTAVSRNDMDGSCNIPSYMKNYEITESDISSGIAASDSLEPGCTLVKNGEDDITLTSTDPILYSVSYQIDDGIDFPNPTCGDITMNGFEKGFYTVDGTNGRFEAWIAAGEMVDVTILPNKGYQYQKDTLNINGQVISNATPGESRGTYRFEMPANAGHICAGFAKTSDIVSVTNDKIASAGIANTNAAISNGNAKLEIASAVVSNEVSTAIAEKAGDYIVAETLEVDLSEVVIKNYDPESQNQSSWDTALHELTSPVTISVELGTGLRGGTSYEVVRVHNGQTELLKDVSYNSQTGTLTFPTDRFSIYAIAYKKTGENTSSGADTSGDGSTSSSTGGSTTPSVDSETGNTTTETKPDGTKVETSTDTKADGTKVDTMVETKTDGTKTETVVETAKDGSVKTTETVTKADGSATKTEKETATNTKGKEVAITITTEKDVNGQVTGITQTSEIERISGSASATVTVEKTADGKITSAMAEVDKKGASSKQGVGATLFGSVVSQITEAAGTKSVDISMTVTAGKKEYIVKADAQDLEAGNKLKVMAIDEKTGNYVMVNAKTYTVNKSGSVKVVLPEGMTYQLMDTKEAAVVEKQIMNSVKVKKTSVTVEKGKKTAVQLNSKLDMDNVEKITYSTSKKSVATVNKNGTVTTKQSGIVTIQAKVLLKNGKTKTVKMKVNVTKQK